MFKVDRLGKVQEGVTPKTGVSMLAGHWAYRTEVTYSNEFSEVT